MKKLSLFCATALTTLAMGAADAEARTTAMDNTNKNTGYVHTESAMKATDQNLESMQNLLRNVYQAQVSIKAEDKATAMSHIEQAMSELNKIEGGEDHNQNFIEDVMEDNHFSGRKVVEVEFDDDAKPRKTLTPVASGDVSIDSVGSALALGTVKKNSIEEAEIRYISYDFDKEDVRKQLTEARNELAENDFYRAQFNLLQVQADVVEDADDDTVSAKTRARDHIALTRFLVKNQQFDAARETLEVAEDAAEDIENNRSASKEFKGEIKSLDKQIAQQDPNMFETIDRKLEAWWNELS